MPAQLQCLNALRTLKQQNAVSKVAFSTTARALANGPTSNAANDLLSSIDSPHDRIQLPMSQRKRRTSADPDQPYSRSTGFSNTPGNASANQHMKNLIDEVSSRANARTSAFNAGKMIEDEKLATSMSKQILRRWRAGDVYAPHDLSPMEMQKWGKKRRPEVDAFDVLDMNPLEEYKNFSIMSEYMTPLGRIMSSEQTGLRRVNQRRIARAIRRSIGLGLMPSVHRHPEILHKQGMRMVMQKKRW